MGREGRGVGWALGVGGKPKAGNTIHKETNSSAVSSVGAHKLPQSNPAGPDGRQQLV